MSPLEDSFRYNRCLTWVTVREKCLWPRLKVLRLSSRNPPEHTPWKWPPQFSLVSYINWKEIDSQAHRVWCDPDEYKRNICGICLRIVWQYNNQTITGNMTSGSMLSLPPALCLQMKFWSNPRIVKMSRSTITSRFQNNQDWLHLGGNRA